MNRAQLHQAVTRLLDEADELDRLADKHPDPAPMPALADVDLPWIVGRLGPTLTRQYARNLREQAARLARSAKDRR